MEENGVKTDCRIKYMELLRKDYGQREVDKEKTFEVVKLCEHFLEEVRPLLEREKGWDLDLFGSVAGGMAVYREEGCLVLHDVDFRLFNKNDPNGYIELEDAQALRYDSRFWKRTQAFLDRVSKFARGKGIRTYFLAADFIFDSLPNGDFGAVAITYKDKMPTQ